MGSLRVPGILILHCNDRLHGNAYIITFKAEPLSTHILAPSVLPLLDTRAEGFTGNLLQFGHSFRFDDIDVCETCPQETHFRNREQLKVTRRVLWLGDDGNGFLGEELLHKRCMFPCVIEMMKPLSLPLFVRLPPKCIEQPL